MTFDEVMGELRRLGTEQNRKTYQRHGSGDDVYGVSFAHLGALRKRIKTDHALARRLWASGNADARMLAAMIADPAQLSVEEAERWLTGVTYPVLIDVLTKETISRGSMARAAMERWLPSDDEWFGRAGWNLLGQIAEGDSALPDAFFEPHLAAVEAKIHRARNRTREAMNLALIRIGARSEGLRKLALAAAKRIGKVEVDHGDTACETRDATEYIEKMWARRGGKEAANGAKKAAGAAKKAAPAKQAAGGAKKAAPAKKAAGSAKKAAPAKKAAKRATARA